MLSEIALTLMSSEIAFSTDFVDAGAVEDSKEADWKPTKSAGAKKLGRPREPPADAANERPAKRTRQLSKRAGGGEDISGGGPAGEAAVPAAGDRADAHAQAVAEVKDGQGSVGPAAKEPVPQAGGLAGAAEARRGNVARGPSVENKPSKSPYKPMSSLPPAPPKTVGSSEGASPWGPVGSPLRRCIGNGYPWSQVQPLGDCTVLGEGRSVSWGSSNPWLPSRSFQRDHYRKWNV